MTSIVPFLITCPSLRTTLWAPRAILDFFLAKFLACMEFFEIAIKLTLQELLF